MKFRYFILIGFILVLLSLTAVSADENVTVEDDTVDLSVDVEAEDTYDGDEYNREGYTVSWIVGVENSKGTAYSTRVQVSLSKNMETVSYYPTRGSYDIKTGIWDVGDLKSNENAALMLKTKLLEDGRFTVSAIATTDSNDTYPDDNFNSWSIESGGTNNHPNIKYRAPPQGEVGNKTPESVTTTSDSRGNHNEHYASQTHGGFGDRQIAEDEVETQASEDNNASLRGSIAKNIQNHDSNLNTVIIIVFVIMIVAVIGYRKLKK